MKKKPKLNVRLLRKVQKHILEEPRRLDMSFWKTDVPAHMSPCGTQACIAGWVTILAGKRIRNVVRYPEVAAKLLGIQFSKREGWNIVDEYSEAGKLFLESRWPSQFRGNDLDDDDGAQLASDRIDHFIKYRE